MLRHAKDSPQSRLQRRGRPDRRDSSRGELRWSLGASAARTGRRMFLINGQVHWSASDLTAAAECEYALLRTLDYKLGWAERSSRRRTRSRAHRSARRPPRGATPRAAAAAAEVAGTRPRRAAVHDGEAGAAGDATLKAFMLNPTWSTRRPSSTASSSATPTSSSGPTTAGSCATPSSRAGEAEGTAPARRVRRADPTMGLPLSSRVSLLLGNGERADFRVADVLPVFLERRDAAAQLHRRAPRGGCPSGGVTSGSSPAASAPSAQHAADRDERCDPASPGSGWSSVASCERDAGIADHRRPRRGRRAARRHGAGDLRQAPRPGGAAVQPDAGRRGRARRVRADVDSAPKTLALLPAPSDGDLFFDFEGDPLYDEGDPEPDRARVPLGRASTPTGEYIAALGAQLDRGAGRVRRVHGPRGRASGASIRTCTSTTTRRTRRRRSSGSRCATRPRRRSSTTCSARRSSSTCTPRCAARCGSRQPSYSIKKLEPLYMGDELRSDDDDAVADGGASVVAYHEYRDRGSERSGAAEARLAALADYNEYDCLSTLRLRDWLLDRADEAGVRDQIVPRIKDVQGEELSENDPVFLALMAQSGPDAAHEAHGRGAGVRDARDRASTTTGANASSTGGSTSSGSATPSRSGATPGTCSSSSQPRSSRTGRCRKGRATNARRVRPAGRRLGARQQGRLGCSGRLSDPRAARVVRPDGAPYGAAGSDRSRVRSPVTRASSLLTESRKPARHLHRSPGGAGSGDMPPRTDKHRGRRSRRSRRPPLLPHRFPARGALDILARRPPRLVRGRRPSRRWDRRSRTS